MAHQHINVYHQRNCFSLAGPKLEDTNSWRAAREVRPLTVVAQLLRRVQQFWVPMDCTHQVPLSMGFPRQEYWSGLLHSSPGDLPDPELEPTTPALAGRFFTTELPGKPLPSTDIYKTNSKTGSCQISIFIFILVSSILKVKNQCQNGRF